ncbi:acyl-CoA dehydrogenase NM domain-like protein [Pisolithus croceorrhizus]|nr:acyl-CoA dehydrogenase NM domain-like protein [Pisolithus croceorrhizus]
MGLQYAVMAEILGRGGQIASEAVNCSAPDTGNMEVLARYGSPDQQKKWLTPLLNGEIRSAFSMTERYVSSSDARNIKTSIRREGNDIVINGHKWWISGAGDPRTRHSVVVVPADTPGVRIVRPMEVFGYDDATGRTLVPLSNLVLGWGRGFEVSSGSIALPGRIHHCMRSIGAASYALDLMIQRVTDPARKTFGKYLYEHVIDPGTKLGRLCTSDTVVAEIAKSRAEIEGARLLVLSAALPEIGIAKVSLLYSWFLKWPCTVVDRAMQAFGAEGLSPRSGTCQHVHIQQVGQRELRRANELRKRAQELRQKEAIVFEKAGIRSRL